MSISAYDLYNRDYFPWTQGHCGTIEKNPDLYNHVGWWRGDNRPKMCDGYTRNQPTQQENSGLSTARISGSSAMLPIRSLLSRPNALHALNSTAYPKGQGNHDHDN